jgi:hypothetical protein
MTFMTPKAYTAGYFEVETTSGTEIVPDFVVDCTTAISVEALLDYLEGTPFDPDAMIEPQKGVVWRLSADGYLDCTSWGAAPTMEKAYAQIEEMYGDEE